jgi:hypothetical protein
MYWMAGVTRWVVLPGCVLHLLQYTCAVSAVHLCLSCLQLQISRCYVH